MKRFSVYKVLFIMLCLGMTGNVWGGHGKVNLTINQSTGGKGYVNGGSKWGDAVPTGTPTSAEGTTTWDGYKFYLYAVADYGYAWKSWTNNTTGNGFKSFTNTTDKDAEYKVNYNYAWGTPDTRYYTVDVTFERSQIVLQEPTFSYSDQSSTHTITLENPSAEGTWTIEDKNILTTDEWVEGKVDDTNAALSFDKRVWKLRPEGASLEEDATIKPTGGSTTVPMTYTLPLADEGAMKALAENYHKKTKTFKATFAANTGTTGHNNVSTEGSGEISIDLTPYFEITAMPENIFVGEGETRQDATIAVKLKATNENVTDNITWSIPAHPTEGSDDFVITSNLNPANTGEATFTVRFVPDPDLGKGIFTAVFPITAEYFGVKHTIECTIVGLYQVDKGEINVLKEGTNYNGQTLDLDLGSECNVSEEFIIEHVGVKDFTIEASGDAAIQYTTETIDASHTRLKVTGTLDALTRVSKTWTFDATSTIGEEKPLETVTLTLQFTNSYADPLFNATVNADNIVLAWRNNPFASTYTLYRDGDLLTPTPLDASVNNFTDDENINGKKPHTYILETRVGEKTYTSTIHTAPVGMTVDVPATRDDEGNALFDELYIIVSETSCEVYDVQTDYSYKKRGTYNPTTWRPGRIDGTSKSIFTQADGTPDNKRIYITGTCENLFWDGTNADGKDNYMGWMQPVNCHVYLDNVRLQAVSKLTEAQSALVNIPGLMISSDSDYSDYIWKNTVPKSASIFYLPDGESNAENTSTIHLRGMNYLCGGVAESWRFDITGGSIQQDGYGTQSLWVNVAYKTPCYSAPIAIKDASFFDTSRDFTNGSTDSKVVTNKDALRKDAYEIPNVPDITCLFDAVWVDGKIVDGYVDLATRACQNGDMNTKEINNSDNVSHEDKIIYTYWTNFVGYRYTPCLVTGGKHGKYVINGGRVNLWPANGSTTDIYYQIQLASILAKIVGGHTANYLACGTNRWEVYLDNNLFSQSTGSFLFQSATDIINGFIKHWDPKPYITLYGVGQAQPVGTLEINGGTITANTDPNSFAVRYTDASGNSQKNVDQDGSGQPLLGPKNLTITGGTFQTEIYATQEHGAGDGTTNTKWNTAVTNTTTAVNKATTPQSLSRVNVPMPAANTDYSKYVVDVRESSALTPNNDEVGYIVNAGTADEYQYGMANVWSDKNEALCHFYWPTDKGAFYRNYHVKHDETLAAFNQPAYNITVDAGGEITVADVLVPGRIAYRPSITEGLYQTISMPFTVEKMYATEPDGNFYFTGYAEDRDNPTIDNSLAYAYIYHMDDGNGNPYSLAADERFKEYYHTHPDGLMQKGKTYVMKFPDFGGYFEDNPVTLLGAKGQTINASTDYISIDAMRPTENNVFALVGNATFMTQDITGESVYLLNQDDNCFHINDSQTTLAPLQGVVLANEITSRKVRVLGKPLVTTDLGNTLAGATIIGSDSKIIVIPAVQAADVQVYAADGQLVGTYTAAEGTPTLIPATAGVYMVRIADSVTKVMVW